MLNLLELIHYILRFEGLKWGFSTEWLSILFSTYTQRIQSVIGNWNRNV